MSSSPFALPGAVLLRPSLDEGVHLLAVGPGASGAPPASTPCPIPRCPDASLIGPRCCDLQAHLRPVRRASASRLRPLDHRTAANTDKPPPAKAGISGGFRPCSLAFAVSNLSGRLDSNQRPPGPQPGALPDCATPRGLLDSTDYTKIAGRPVTMGTYVRHALLSNRPRPADVVESSSRPLILPGVGERVGSGQLLPHVQGGLQTGALCSEPRALRRERRAPKQVLIAERTAYLIELFRERPCVDCGETEPLVLEFDHLGHKNFSIAAGLRNRNWQSVLDEIASNVVRANCHRRRTAHRAGFARAAVAQR
jgi:hypothetical protein